MKSLIHGLNVSDVLRNLPTYIYTKTMELMDSIIIDFEYDKVFIK